MTSGTQARPAAEVTATVDRLLDSWGQVQSLMARLPTVVEERFGIPRHRFHVLTAVQRGATRIQDIADANWTSVSAASRTVDGLVRDGIVDRRPDPDDRRASLVTLTARGQATMDLVRTWAEGMVVEMVEALGPARVGRVAEDLEAFADRISATLDRDTVTSEATPPGPGGR